MLIPSAATVVYAYAKILILKQITTGYYFLRYHKSCICLCKDTNFKANHNGGYKYFICMEVVYAYAKILILKQITTNFPFTARKLVLYMPMQRY